MGWRRSHSVFCCAGPLDELAGPAQATSWYSDIGFSTGRCTSWRSMELYGSSANGTSRHRSDTYFDSWYFMPDGCIDGAATGCAGVVRLGFGSQPRGAL